MEIIVSARHMDLTDSLRDEAESRVGKLESRGTKLTKAEVVLDANKDRFKAEIILHGKGINMEADAVSGNMYDSIHQAADKLERQLVKKMERLNDHSKKSLGSLEAEAEANSSYDEDELLETY